MTATSEDLIGLDVRLPDGHAGQIWALGPPSPRNRAAGVKPPRRERVWVAVAGGTAVLVHADELHPITEQPDLLGTTHQQHQETSP